MRSASKARWAAAGLLAAAGLGAHRARVLRYAEFRSLRVEDRHGVLLREVLSGREGTSAWTPLEEMPRALIEATLAAEDKRFFRHWGVDPAAVARAARANLRRGRVVQGASTLTQQLIRIVDPRPRTWAWKTLEAARAVALELTASKRTILAHYLNRAPYGNQAFGVAAAAHLYFDKPARHLSTAEAAFLAGLPQGPTRYDPLRHPERARRRQRAVLARMAAEGYLSKREFELAVNEPLALVPKARRFRAPHFVDWTLAHAAPDASGRLRTTLEWGLQEEVEKITAAAVAALRSENVSNGAVVVLDNASGEVRAMVGSADFFDAERHGQVNGALAARPPGSTWKPFAYGMALERGMSAATVLADVELHAVSAGGDFAPRNYDERFHGPVRLRTALASSYNITAVRVLERVGVQAFLNKLRALGFDRLTGDPGRYGLGLVLGGAEADLLQLARAYRALALGRGAFSPAVSSLLTDILSDADARIPAFGPHSALDLPFPAAAKTGTSKNFRDAWTLGYTADYTVGVWMGNFDGTPSKGMTGASAAAPVFRDVMMHLHRARRPRAIPVRGGLVRARVCPRSGLRPGSDCPAAMNEWFLPGTAPRAECDVHRRVALDARNDLLAGADCPPEHVQEVTYEVYGPEYRLWAAEHDIPEPPAEVSPLCAKAAAAPAPARAPRPAIAYPDAGDVFVLDPVLRPEYQTVKLSPEVGGGVREVEWSVDGRVLARAGAPFAARWPLERGHHRFGLRARVGDAWHAAESVSIFVK